ncbi:ABC transporter family protein [Asticcacaulis biprosthecium C19]|uniref:ABC transporter family protein n=1 Tax=Asticcacaulis biprosthecium C19 TaxID=715226 RepID=F4QR12_9CAUL|nr:ABC transporter ATP-binding protein [Asticcacaulis biprosthecium]EGF90649.1 ABC transporter family protein [Asticcacaulis biprosthecium C19]
MATLDLSDVSVILGGETVVQSVSAHLEAGKLYVVVGPNGAGKTTLLKAMASLLRLDGGKVTLNGEDVVAMPPMRRAAHMAYLPQERSIAWDLPSVDVAALGCPHLTPELARQKAFSELQALGLQEVSDRGVFGLSGGQRARVLLARVLVSSADIYLLDEPLIALDPAWQRHVLIRLRERADEGKTVVLSLHDLHLAAQFADEILLMHRGQLVRKAGPEIVFSAKYLSEVFNLKGELNDVAGQRILRLESMPLL